MRRATATLTALAVLTAGAAGLAGGQASAGTAGAAGLAAGQASAGPAGHAREPAAGGHRALHRPDWRLVPTGSDQQLRGLDAVSARVAWVSGEDGAVLRTTSGGRTWRKVSPAHSRGLLFRDVEATDATHASVLAIGAARASRIYTTRNGGRTWTLAFVNHDRHAFYDCMAFFPGTRRGLAVSDPVRGKFRILATTDRGLTWRVLPRRGMPAAQHGEFGFAASGTCLVTTGRHDAWLATGGGVSRIFHSRDDGHTWVVKRVPIPADPAGAGIFSLAFKNKHVGVAVGGDFNKPDKGASARSLDGGQRWRHGGSVSGYRSGSAWVDRHTRTVITVGPNGSDVSHNAGRTWTRFDSGDYDAASCTGWGSCWASGPDGVVARLSG